MKWSGTRTTFAGSKTFFAPIFSIARNAIGTEMSFVITTSQRTITMSPGATSSTSLWASRIFSASVCGTAGEATTAVPAGQRAVLSERLDREVAAVDDDGRARDVARGVRGEEDDDIGDLLRGADAAERVCAGDLSQEAVGLFAVHPGQVAVEHR